MKQQAIRRRIEFDPETWHALNQLGLESGSQIEEFLSSLYEQCI